MATELLMEISQDEHACNRRTPPQKRPHRYRKRRFGPPAAKKILIFLLFA